MLEEGETRVEVLGYEGDDQSLYAIYTPIRLRLKMPVAAAILWHRGSTDLPTSNPYVEFVDAKPLSDIASLCDDLSITHRDLQTKVDAAISATCPLTWKMLRRSRDSVADLQCGIDFIK